MDTQLRKGLLDVCVLSAIKNEDSYGYKIIKDLKPVLELSESTLYTILKRLEEGKMLQVKMTIFEGRVRKYYHITALGVQAIIDTAARHKISFFILLPPRHHHPLSAWLQ